MTRDVDTRAELSPAHFMHECRTAIQQSHNKVALALRLICGILVFLERIS